MKGREKDVTRNGGRQRTRMQEMKKNHAGGFLFQKAAERRSQRITLISKGDYCGKNNYILFEKKNQIHSILAIIKYRKSGLQVC